MPKIARDSRLGICAPRYDGKVFTLGCTISWRRHALTAMLFPGGEAMSGAGYEKGPRAAVLDCNGKRSGGGAIS